MQRPVNLHEQIAELKRELVMRGRVYPGLVSGGKLSPTEAERRNRALEAAVKTLETLSDKQFTLELGAVRRHA
jgi:hypothetical protein